MASSEKSGACFVGENFDDEEGGRAAGTFAVHWEDPEGTGFKEGPTAASVEEAIAWGRERAPVVTVLLLDDTMYSAGEVPPEGDEGPIPPWPEGGLTIRPRPIGSPLDGSVQELGWTFIGRLREAGITEQVRQRIEAQVQTDDRVACFELVRRGRVRKNDWEVRLELTARGTTSAILAADALISQAVADALPGRPLQPEQLRLELSSAKG